jgi:hypothetical protein
MASAKMYFGFFAVIYSTSYNMSLFLLFIVKQNGVTKG